MTDAEVSRPTGQGPPEQNPHDLVFTLLVRLPNGRPEPTRPWIPWPRPRPLEAASGDPAPALLANKRYPGGRQYFAPQVEAVLFPDALPVVAEAGLAGRWVREPVAESLELGGADGSPEAVLAIDLLEMVRVSLHPNVTFGVVHFSARGPLDSEAMLRASRLLWTPWRSGTGDRPRFAVVSGSDSVLLAGHEPLRALTIRLFGDAHRDVMHRAHTFVAARVPSTVAAEEERIWRRAIGRAQSFERAELTLRDRSNRDDYRTEPISGTTATFFGHSTAVTHRMDPTEWVYNVRSYWSEAVLFGLIQQSYLEFYAQELGRLGGDPTGEAVDALFLDWVAFRNVLWWKELSYTTDMPGRILAQVHGQLRSEPLFTELERAFGTYVEARRHKSEDTERKALRGLQVYGAAFAVVSAVAGVTQVATAENLGTPRWILYALAVVLGVLAGLATWAVLRRGGRDQRSRQIAD
jgi:hypothetical protein